VTLIKKLLLMLINVTVLATSCINLPPAPSVLQEGSSDGFGQCQDTRQRPPRYRFNSNALVSTGLSTFWALGNPSHRVAAHDFKQHATRTSVFPVPGPVAIKSGPASF
jgi:hypothetical protein